MPLWGAPQAGAPPLKPTLKLYRELYRVGFSVTFITGRQAQPAPPGPGLTVGEDAVSKFCASHSSPDMRCRLFAYA